MIFVDVIRVLATSAVDLDTDKAIQDIMSGSEFSDVTVITIAYVFIFIWLFALLLTKVGLFSVID